MVDPFSTGPARKDPLSSTGASAPGKSIQSDSAQASGKPEFQALLEQLQQKSRSLSADSQSVAKPEDLSGAVVRARSTLTDALSLSDQLLEAYRQAGLSRDKNEADGSVE